MTFAGEHWFLFWCALWLWWGFFVAWIAAVNAVSKLCNRILRSLNILMRGWPPEHLDADGDFRELPENDENSGCEHEWVWVENGRFAYCKHCSAVDRTEDFKP
ncbi:hypothetical protein OAV22_02095 [Flavobacteriaceae bacterium]|nr:hypothetical protein [Flavobacteriaceae bacterium]